MNKQKSKSLAAAKSGMEEKTARKYFREGKLPSQLKKPRNYRTRNDLICYSESLESLSEGLQNAVWKLVVLTHRHRTDNLSAVVHKDCNPEEFTQRYRALRYVFTLNNLNYGTEGDR